MHAPLIETTRGFGSAQFTENIHYGSIAVVNQGGQLIASVGDPDFITFSRSTIKPFQASPLINDDGVTDLGLTTQEIAVMCSSHSGEQMHLQEVLSLLKKSDSQVTDLQCGCHTPLFYGVNDQKPPKGSVWNESHNNCSGKHAGMLAWCHLHGKPKSNYLDLGHPLQQAIRRNLSIWCDTPESSFAMGIDGCSAPNYGLPLRALALSYARLADNKRGETAKLLFNAMTTYPELVSGTKRHDLAFMTAGNKDWVAKVGADGVQLIGIRSAGLGIAVKVADGNQRAVIATAIEVLRQLGQIADVDSSVLADWARPVLKNVTGKTVGQVQPVFKLKN